MAQMVSASAVRAEAVRPSAVEVATAEAHHDTLHQLGEVSKRMQDTAGVFA